MASQALYDNFKLASGQIRLICIHKGTGPQITAHLKTISIGQPRGISSWLASFWNRYEALSYYWGNPVKSHSISCNGQTLEIHSNLYDALAVLRQIRPGVPIWTDAICINQNDEEERNAQLRIMGHIYGGARQVWSFLGMPPSNMEKLMTHLPQICRVCKARQAFEHKRGLLTPDKLRNISSVWHHEPSLPETDSPIWKTLKDLMENEYFNRLWILQEVALAKRVVFLCGRYKLSWSQMELLFDSGQRLQGLQRALAPKSGVNATAFHVQGLTQMTHIGLVPRLLIWGTRWFVATLKRFFQSKRPDIDPVIYETLENLWTQLTSSDLDHLLDYAAGQRCTYPRDRVLGITAMMRALLDEDEFPWMKKDMTSEEIYLEAFYFLAIHDQSFKLLTTAPPSPELGLMLPSWCPDFRSNTVAHALPMGFSDRALTGWHASAKKQAIIRGLDIEKLRLIGVRVTNVSSVSETWKTLDLGGQMQPTEEFQDQLSYNTTWLDNCLHLVLEQHAGADDRQLNSLLVRFWSTNVLETPHLIGLEDIRLDDFLRLPDFLRRAKSPSSSYAEEIKKSRAKRELSGSSKQPLESDILARLNIELHGKVFFTTENGDFGLAYPGVLTGDTLCVFQGAKVPHLLRERRNSNTWTFVGEAYVRDLMHGEAEKALDGNFPKSESFILV